MVPFTRGPERSRTSASVIAEARQLAQTPATPKFNCSARTSTAIAILRPPGGISRLCSITSADVPGIRRVRFTTSHPRDFVKAIIDAIDDNPALCNHVHLPVQSGSTRILDAMQRLYTRDEYMRRIEWMKNARRPIAITTDIIVGFPGETEAGFRRDSGSAEEVEFDSIFGFKYSRRPNTPALALDDQIPEEEKTRRLAIVQE